MALTKDIERLVRSFVAQKMEPEYIRHYLMENYMLGPVVIDQIFEKLGVGMRKKTMPGMDGGAPRRAPIIGADGKVRKSQYY